MSTSQEPGPARTEQFPGLDQNRTLQLGNGSNVSDNEDTRVCEQLARSRYMKVELPGFKPISSQCIALTITLPRHVCSLVYVRDMNCCGSCRAVIVSGDVGYTVDHVSDISQLATRRLRPRLHFVATVLRRI